MLDYVARDTISKGRSRNRSVTLDVDFPLFTIGDGRVEVASGIEFREESLVTHPDPVMAAAGTIGGTNFGPTDAERDVAEAYVEMLLPIVRDRPGIRVLDIHLSGRLSDYRDFGNTSNPKVAVRYKPHDQWTLRGSVSRGFRAPTLSQLFISTTESFELLNDPCSNPERVPNLSGCLQPSDPTLVQFLVTNGGNADLKPETTRNHTFGLIYTPGSLQASVDYYWIRQRNVVDSSAQFILDQNAEFQRFGDRVFRDQNGNLTAVAATLLNLGSRDVRGLDLTARYLLDASDFGKLEFGLNATHIHSYRDKFIPTLPSVEQAGRFSDAASEGNGALPNWKASLGVNWQREYWQAQYDVHYVSSIDEEIPLLGTERTMEPWYVHNVQVKYDGPATRWFSLALGINNLLDEAPPFSAAAFNDSHDSRTYDITGRYWYVRIGKSI